MTKYGMIGTGMVAGWLAKGIQNCERSELTAVASRSEDKASAFGSRHSIANAYGTYEDLIKDSDIDAVIIATPNTLHREWTEKAAAAGKHVLCEKPAAMTSEDVSAMVSACEAANVRFMEAAMYRFQPQIAKILQLASDGTIGRPLLVHGAFCFPFNQSGNIRLQKNMGGGCLFDLGFYPVSFAALLAGKLPKNVFGASLFSETDVEISTSALLQFDSGLSAVIQCAFSADVKIHAEITGTEGRIRIPDPWTARENSKEVEIWKNKKIVETLKFEDPNAYTAEVDHFSDVINDRADQIWTTNDTLRTVRILEAISRSCRIEEAIRLG